MAVLAGGMLPLQTAMKAMLANAVGTPIWAAAISGTVVLCATTALTPRIGSAAMIALVIAGQVLASLAREQCLLFGEVQHGSETRSGHSVTDLGGRVDVTGRPHRATSPARLGCLYCLLACRTDGLGCVYRQ